MFEAQAGRCYYCGVAMAWAERTPAVLPEDYPTFDHRNPASRGGGDGWNVVLACWGCNRRKADMSEAEFRAAAA